MDNENENENLQVTADAAEAEKEIAAGGLGKFKSVDALLSAYQNLEAEFTRRSQRLKELEEGNKAGEGISPPSAQEDKKSVLEQALCDENVKNAVIGEYLKSVAGNKSVPLIVGGKAVAAPKCAPRTLKEAGALAKQFLKH